MSAIAGALNFNEEPICDESIGNMMSALRVYPSNDVGIWQGGSIFLGCHAQWITPESVNEQLPRYDGQHKLAITADAIIDNREELFGRLQIDFALRKRMKDSELILLAYRKWGKDAPKYLIGDFAFVIWDEKKRRLFGARDLAGSRTLYYRYCGRRFAFCTVMNPLFALDGLKKEINEAWLAEFLAIPIILDTIDVHSTVYRHIGQIPPAHSFTVEDGKLVLEQYGSLAAPVEKLHLKSNEEYEEAFREVFREAVTSKLRTYRQVGASLSGGLDSGAVAGFAASPLRREGKPLHTYSYVPPSDFVDWTSRWYVADERPYIQAAVEHIGNIKANYLDFPDSNSYGVIDDVLGLMEAPYKMIENSFWLKGVLEQAERDDVGVLLNGGSGNYTVSWGPATDYYALLLRRLRFVHLYRELKLYGKHMEIGRARLVPIIAKQAFPFVTGPPFRSIKPDIPLLIHPDLAARTAVLDKLKNYDVGLTESSFDEFDARDDHLGNPANFNHLGTSATKLSLRHGVRGRDPTSDPRVVRFCLSLPVEQYVQHGIERSIIRRATRDYLPDKVRLNVSVRGIQGADWIHRMTSLWPDVTRELEMLCSDSAASQYLNVTQIRESLAIIGRSPEPRLAYDQHMKIVMRSLIVYRFIRQIA
ncbi:asparagine synthase-related protein [Paenibacillus tarimensis]